MTAHEHEHDADGRAPGVSRRTMLRGATVGGLALPVLAACGSSSDSGSDSPSSGDSPSSSGSASPSSGGSSGSSAPGTIAAKDVPVGGGTVIPDQKVVVVQPTKGDFKAYTAICTHQGCTVGQVEGGDIICPCHGSRFSIKDGAPVSGPAQAPLAAKKVSVSGGEITVA
jgi:nitrite reductase/ring-hydroxylating ferredoxin subunit